jgi:hypothetical protein
VILLTRKKSLAKRDRALDLAPRLLQAIDIPKKMIDTNIEIPKTGIEIKRVDPGAEVSPSLNR